MIRSLAIGIFSLTGVGLVWANDRPNIILISADDLMAYTTGFEGHPVVRTPNLDRLAAEGARFTRSYVPTPQGAPVQACILTGQYPHTHGVTTDGMELPFTSDTFTARLKDGGYTCGIVGKWELPWARAPKPGFGLVDFVRTDDETLEWTKAEVWVDGKKQIADKYLTDWHADQAIEFLDTFHERTFFLWLSFRAPHKPLYYPPGQENLYPPKSVDRPVKREASVSNWPNHLRRLPAAEDYKRCKRTLQTDRSQYYAMITKLDENIGRVLQHLDERGLRDRTVVVFTSDGGQAIGEHRLCGTGPIFFEEVIRVPLLIRYDGLAKPGMVTDRVVSLVDLAPTFCELAGLDGPIRTQGKSLVPLLADPEADPRADECFLEYAEYNKTKIAVRGIVTQRYKLINYLRDKTLFYDLAYDSNEMENLAFIPQYKGVIMALSNRLDYWRKQTRDPEPD